MSSIYCIVCSPPQVKSPSNTIYPLYNLLPPPPPTHIPHLIISRGQESGHSFARELWLRVSHEVVNQDFGWSCIHLKASQVLKDLSSSSSYGHWKETYIFTSCWLDISVRTMWASPKAAQLTLKHGSWLPPE